jgi:hypothetical protein
VNVELLDVPYRDEIVQQLSPANAVRFGSGSCRANDGGGIDIGPYGALPGTTCTE